MRLAGPGSHSGVDYSSLPLDLPLTYPAPLFSQLYPRASTQDTSTSKYMTDTEAWRHSRLFNFQQFWNIITDVCNIWYFEATFICSYCTVTVHPVMTMTGLSAGSAGASPSFVVCWGASFFCLSDKYCWWLEYKCAVFYLARSRALRYDNMPDVSHLHSHLIYMRL